MTSIRWRPSRAVSNRAWSRQRRLPVSPTHCSTCCNSGGRVTCNSRTSPSRRSSSGNRSASDHRGRSGSKLIGSPLAGLGRIKVRAPDQSKLGTTLMISSQALTGLERSLPYKPLVSPRTRVSVHNSTGNPTEPEGISRPPLRGGMRSMLASSPAAGLPHRSARASRSQLHSTRSPSWTLRQSWRQRPCCAASRVRLRAGSGVVPASTRRWRLVMSWGSPLPRGARSSRSARLKRTFLSMRPGSSRPLLRGSGSRPGISVTVRV